MKTMRFSFICSLCFLSLAADCGVVFVDMVTAFAPASPPLAARTTNKVTTKRDNNSRNTVGRFSSSKSITGAAADTALSSSTSATADSSSSSLPLFQKTITKAGNDPVQLGDIVTIKYACYVPGNLRPFAKSDSSSPSKMVVGSDNTNNIMIDGWDMALRSMKVGEECLIRLGPELAYGTNGVEDFIPPSSQIELELKLLDATPATANIDFDSLAEAADATTPRTASDIAAAFEARQQLKASAPKELEGLDGFLQKAKNFYFYGLFEGETGERPPWFLRPSITFPIAFAVVGAAFYISYVNGAITERGAQITDELDEIILSSTITTMTTHLLAAAAESSSWMDVLKM